ncbi:MAG: hypothetical protein MR701_02090 [Clostridiales bacterium]|jgi:hypothetical protein|nr:hypothetical protein [Clostridiales bacterium]
MKFPNYFPEGCPPKDAISKEEVVYRVCKNDPITRKDFASYYELGKGKHDVKHYGVSVFSNCGEAKTICLMPNHRQEFVAKGKTVEECGVIKATPSNKNSSHITWWLYEEARPQEHFNAIKENENE